MLKLLKGNPENLEGKVLVYCDNLASHCEHDRYPAVLAAMSLLDIIPDFGVEVSDDVKQYLKDAEERMESAIEQGANILVPVCLAPVLVSSPQDALTSSADVAYAGIVAHKMLAPQLLDAAAQLYMVNYDAQLHGRLKTAAKPSTQDDFRKYDGNGVKSRLYSYIGRLLDFSADPLRKDQVIADIKAFNTGAPWFGDIVNLIGVAQTNIATKQPLIEAYVEKIAAIRDERFEDAARCKNQIEEFLKGR